MPSSPSKHHAVAKEIRRTRTSVEAGSLFLATSCGILLPFARNHLAKHHHAVAIHEGDAGEALAVLEGVAHQRLLGLEAALGHFVGLQRVRVFHLLAARLLAHLPLKLRDAAGGAA